MLNFRNLSLSHAPFIRMILCFHVMQNLAEIGQHIYGQKCIFNMAAVRHLELKKKSFSTVTNVRLKISYCVLRP